MSTHMSSIPLLLLHDSFNNLAAYFSWWGPPILSEAHDLF
jgi:hypothetical protein